MKFWVVSNPLPQVNTPKYQMYAVSPNPNYPCYKYCKDLIGIRVSNGHNYVAIIDILDCNWGEFEYRVQNYPPNWA